MEIRVLKYFLTVAREESITRAAEMLHITQPTLSRQLAQLEDEIGVKLLERGSRKIALTSEGILLRRRAEEILQLVDKTQRDLVEQGENIAGKISIGCGDLTSVQLLVKILFEFNKKYSNITYEILTAASDVITEQMDKGLLDLGLLVEPINIDKYNSIVLGNTEKSVVLLPPTSPLINKQSISAADLADKPLILPSRLPVKNKYIEWLGNFYKSSNVVATCNLITNSAIMVNAGLGYALLVEGSLIFEDSDKIIYRPLEPRLTASTALVWKRGQPLSPALARLIDFVKCFSGIENNKI